jgi:hypothetical protein
MRGKRWGIAAAAVLVALALVGGCSRPPEEPTPKNTPTAPPGVKPGDPPGMFGGGPPKGS